MKKEIAELTYSIYAPMFAERESLKEAFTYAHELAKGSKDPASVYTAMHVVANTIAKELLNILQKDAK
jgi:hemoglobin-like flavoprotein